MGFVASLGKRPANSIYCTVMSHLSAEYWRAGQGQVQKVKTVVHMSMKTQKGGERIARDSRKAKCKSIGFDWNV